MTEVVKGFRDFSGEDARKRSQVKRVVEDTFQLYGFEPAETPVIEQEGFVRGDNADDEAVSDVFKLKDRGKRELALRYEFTFQLKRLARNKKLPYKRYQIGEVFRDEPVRENRFRQFTQCDCDVVGSSIKDEAEILGLAGEIFRKLGIKATFYVNSRKLMNEVLRGEDIREGRAGDVIREIDKLDKLSEGEVKENLKKYSAGSVLEIFKKPESFFEKYEGYSGIQELKKLCKNFGVDVEFMPSLARGLSYYNGTVVEVRAEGKDSIAGGGAYLVNDVQAFGISFGVERVSSFSKLKKREGNVLIISFDEDTEASDVALRLRRKGIRCSMFYGKVGKGLEYGNSLEVPYVIIVGPEEVKSGMFTLKDLNSGKEKKLSVEEIVEGFV
jgi:histidyl-tRNA synthetase